MISTGVEGVGLSWMRQAWAKAILPSIRAAFLEQEVFVVLYRIPLVFAPQPEGGYTVTSPVLPELITEGDTLEEANANVPDALAAVIELYAEQGRTLPAGITLPVAGEVVWADTLVESA